MARFSKYLGVVLLAVVLLFVFNHNVYAKTVALVVNLDNPDYKAAREAFMSSLNEAAKAKSIPVDYITVDSKGNKDVFITEVKNIENKVDLYFTTGTPSALLLKEAGIKKPVIFSAVAGPVGAKLVNSLDQPGTNFTGVHCAVPENRQLKALLLVLPNVKRIGILYNSNDPSPKGQAASWKAAVEAAGLEYKEYFIPDTVNSSDALAEAVRPMIGNVDVIVTTADAKVSPYGDGMIKIANENGIPTYASLTQLVKKGALCSLGFNFTEGAKLSAPQALAIFAGKNPADIAVATFPNYKLGINLKTANILKINLSLEALKTASELIKE